MKVHVNSSRAKPFIPIDELEGLLNTKVKLLFEEPIVNPGACTLSVSVFADELAMLKTHTATITARAMATAISIMVATTLLIPLLFLI